MTRLVHAELRKYLTTRLAWSMPLTMFLLGGIFAAVQGLFLVLLGEIPTGGGGEVIRPSELFDDLTLARMTPDLIYDQVIGAGCARKLIFSWGGNPGVGSLYRLRDAITAGWPGPLEIEEHTHAGLANRYVAGASGLPFAVLRAAAVTTGIVLLVRELRRLGDDDVLAG